MSPTRQMKWVLCFFCALLLLGCEGTSFVGEMEILDDVTLIQKSDGPVTLPPGQYRVSLELKKKKAYLRVFQGDAKKKFRFEIPSGLGLPPSGDFMLTAAQSAQPYDLVGGSKREVTYSSPVETVESCVYYVSYYTCRPYGGGGHGKKHGGGHGKKHGGGHGKKHGGGWQEARWRAWQEARWWAR